MKKTGKSILAEALAILKKEGARVWIKGSDYAANRRSATKYDDAVYKKDADCYCARGLVSKLAGRSTAAQFEAMRLLSAAIPADEVKAWQQDVDSRVTSYNDDNGRTFPQMVRWFKRALETT